MRIKRIFAANTREALRKVREQHGPDAVVISSRNVDGGVEVISAVVKVLQNLLEEGVPIRDMRTIVEALADHGQRTKDA
ncbi:FHIPEP family type III secretion protein, partial [Halorhodospira neutriphila]|uniref:FHIPEP family type III secretion protein n=1 Tax=Halorhodospira neutriphila TaxID=168379 RepID=UPI001902E973